MLRKKKQNTEPRGGLLVRSLASVPILKKLLPGAPRTLQNVGLLVDAFATFAMLDGKVIQREANIILDLLRHAYPEADHGWLARRLQRAIKKPSTLEELASSMLPTLSAQQLTTIGLQLYLLVDSSTQKAQGKDNFLKFMTALHLKQEGASIVKEFEGENLQSEELTFEKLSLSTEGADILLPPNCSNISCKIYRSGPVIILKNTGQRAIALGAIQLPAEASTRLRPHQRLLFPGWAISHTDLQFFLDAKLNKETRTLYVGKSEDVIVAERNRSRHSIFKIKFGLTASIEVLQDTGFKLHNLKQLKSGTTYSVPLFANIIPESGIQVSLNQLRLQALDAGGRFKIDKKQQSCLISNDPENLSSGDLRLSPNLADPVTLVVAFDKEKGSGTLDIIEQGKTPILVNGTPVIGNALLQDGCLIRISPNQGIRCRFSEGLLDEERTIIQQLRVDSLSHKFGKSKALDNIEFTLNRGEMLCIMGPSGSGKSTLLSAIAGQLAPTRGHIRLNEISLYQHHSRLSRFITYMPQEEALSSQLTVREHLRYAIKIRLPNLNSQEIQRRVDTILDELSLQPLASRRVGSPDEKSLSGGERSRLNLGLDLGSQAEIFLFDEPISGLSSKDSEHVAESLKNISRDKIVIASLHRPGAKILSQFDKVLLLDNGGRVAFFGPPNTMRNYFKEACQELQIILPSSENENSADFVFDVLETPLVDIVNTQKFESTRRFPPLFWQERFESYTLYQNVEKGEIPAQTNLGDLPKSDDNMPIPKKEGRKLHEYFRIYKSHFWRSTLSKYRNKGTIYATLLEAPLLAFIIASTLRASADGPYQFNTGLHIVTYLFLSVTVGMFLGLTNSATEILRDRPTLRRERNCRYNNGLYVSAKFMSLAILAAIQCAIYLAIGNWMLEIEGMWLNHWLWMSLTAMCGTAIALFVSSVVKSERAALSAVPLILVPQLLLAGTPLIPFEEMNRGLFSGAEGSRNQGIEPIPSRVIPLRYAYEGIIVDQVNTNIYERGARKIDNALKELKKKNFFAHTYLNEGLSDKDSERMSILKEAKLLLGGTGATNAKEAKRKITKIVHLAQFGTIEQLQQIETYEGRDDIPTCDSYFVNERARDLFLMQDIQRTDITKEEKPNIFLAEEKYFGKEENPDHKRLQTILSEEQITQLPKDQKIAEQIPKAWSTSYICFTVLATLSLCFIMLSTVIVARSNKKVQ